MTPAHRFVDNNPQRENVRAGVGLFFQQNFGWHVGRCAGGQAAPALKGFRGDGVVIGWQLFGHAEVKDLHLAFRSQHDVFRLEVAVDDAPPVRGNQSLGALHGNPQALLNAKGLG